MRDLPLPLIAGAARGVVSTAVTGDVLRLERFDAATLAYYQALSVARHDRALCTAGVTLAFGTDGDRLRVSLDLKTRVRPYSFVDLYVDGLFVASAGSVDAPDAIEAAFTLPGTPGRMRAVELHLTHGRQALIRSLALPAGARFEPAPPRPLLLAFGDSITQGMNAHHPSLAYAAVMARTLGMTLLNQGVGGHVFDVGGLRGRPHPAPGLITVAYGINDWNAGGDAGPARPWLRQVRDWYPQTPLAVFEPIWAGAEGMDVRPESKGAGLTLAAYRKQLAGIVRDLTGVALVPATALLPPVEAFLSDGLHPNDAGHAVFGWNAARLPSARVVCAATPRN